MLSCFAKQASKKTRKQANKQTSTEVNNQTSREEAYIQVHVPIPNIPLIALLLLKLRLVKP